jgi:DNA mismatch repair ATPase MutS
MVLHDVLGGLRRWRTWVHRRSGGWAVGTTDLADARRLADAVEVAAIGKLLQAIAHREHELPALLAIDEPFHGTNPALRVPIVVSVLDYLGHRDMVIAATHDLDVAAQVDARFARGYFSEADDDSGHFDRKLRPGVSPGSNALALLVRAGYPPAIIAAVERRARAG